MWFQRIFSATKRSGRSGVPTVVQAKYELQIPSRALGQLNSLRLNTSRFLPGHGVGTRLSVRRKPASDFREHRKYVPGDDIRFIDWKASARQEHIYIKQGEHQKNVNVYILVDCSASMGWGNPSKAVAALSLVAALGYSALTHGDRLMVVPLQEPDASGKSLAPLGPISGKGQFPALLNYLGSLSFQGSVNLTEAVRYFSRRVAVGSGLTLLISDLLSDLPYAEMGIGTALEYLPMPTWNVVVFHLLHPEELQPAIRGDLELLDVETQATVNYDVTSKALKTYQEHIQAWRSRIELECIENDAFYTLVQSNWALDTEVITTLRELNIVVPL